MSQPPPPQLSPAIKLALTRLSAGESLAEEEAFRAFADIMAGTVSPTAIAALLVGLRVKGESSDEIAGAVRALRGAMRTVDHPEPGLLIDTCGTGGGTITTINISTAAAFVAAGAGAKVAKHGNRSFTSRSGSADVLEALGIQIEIAPEHAASVIQEAGLVFLFAPSYHPAMRHVGPVRRELGVPTLMNLVGPLANPAGVQRQVIGVADPAKGPLVAGALAQLGATHALVVHASVGMDEIAPMGTTTVWEVRDGGVREWQLDPARVALDTPNLVGLEGGEPAENAARIVDLFDHPERAAAAFRAAILLNAGAALLVSGRATTFEEGVAAATSALHSGAARAHLEKLHRAAPASTSE